MTDEYLPPYRIILFIYQHCVECNSKQEFLVLFRGSRNKKIKFYHILSMPASEYP